MFRRPVVGVKLIEWQHLLNIVGNINVGTVRDFFMWKANASKHFSVRFMYNILTPNSNQPRWLWKLKLPLKIKVFL
jgi:hypothetical protein